jgi:hypothetical protein
LQDCVSKGLILLRLYGSTCVLSARRLLKSIPCVPECRCLLEGETSLPLIEAGKSGDLSEHVRSLTRELSGKLTETREGLLLLSCHELIRLRVKSRERLNSCRARLRAWPELCPERIQKLLPLLISLSLDRSESAARFTTKEAQGLLTRLDDCRIELTDQLLLPREVLLLILDVTIEGEEPCRRRRIHDPCGLSVSGTSLTLLCESSTLSSVCSIRVSNSEELSSESALLDESAWIFKWIRLSHSLPHDLFR